ncbi:LysR family transcriptional regulator [Enemella evansiae]|uniref:LysR family transcriptional regulator n=1 Tax=Enemella evansiae TaxID=2016499 RepID=A0A255GGR1_9ACTN|nr:LysR family transcriptional regulator [Enemella evansiae]OYN97728.1 LysR family transcriptional regulator [Enemella evansiae]OYO03049.1 LysR family transcriptional regulator [Enemella evansiae]OYO03732.1 LysR family transcriptional regulator [Enemella evansiae]OYO13503.1 LysR family transcriptional regulator [Enemella evansiae]TDO87776.1 DNA-binding transcriptional LysR family regulator [Enemella evansiae]
MQTQQAPNFSLRQLSYLLTAARLGTISAAAAELHVSSSAISDAITALEQQLQSQLCIRRRAQGLVLTAAGRQVAARAQALLAEANDLERELKTSDGELVGPITIGCYPTLAPLILPVLLAEFGERHPRVGLEIVETTQDRLAGRLESGEIDLAFVYETLIPGTPNHARLFAQPAHVVLAADDPFADRPAVRLEDLVERDMILLDSPPSSQHTLSLFHDRGLRPRIRHRVASYEVVRTLVARGLGYGVLVQRPHNPASYEGYPLVLKEIEPAVAPVAVEIIWPAEVPVNARVRALIEFALAEPRWGAPRSAGEQ